ncbi:O-antigen ligase like membrane protein [Butyrivibrio sp. ob235]|uniref:O-antigen ligase family protein n=1 Tax=Butyrivibrio sp. ob235 TaxID=1761780 RepID=UPI0008AC68A3|nr:O-antigen ligase family protein [Butyrivibrio sp. ob235]SEL73038.1 O-antigen ligase like membrane protein [Butyrivibrio sp. ob235]
MFLFFFSLILLALNIVFFVKKKYLLLFIPCMLFLPSFYGIDFSKSFPVLTVTRLMYIAFFIYAYQNRKKNISLKNIQFNNLPLEFIFLACYFILRIITNICYIFTYSQSIKSIFLIIFEQAFLLIAIYILSPSKDELVSLTKVITWVGGFLFFIGIWESYTSIRPFDNLYTISRYMPNDHYIRFGLLRSTTTMGLPGLFGNMCLFLLPLILYLYNLEHTKKYLGLLLLDAIAIIHSGSRSDIIFFLIINFIYGLFALHKKHHAISYIKHVIILCTSLVVFLLITSKAFPKLDYYYKATLKSNLNVLGIDIELNMDNNVPINDNGGNKNAVSSRTYQFSGIRYAMKKNPLFGLGNGALQNGDVYYYSYDAWRVSYTYDVGLVEILISEGIIGLIAHIALYLFLAIRIFKFIPIHKLDSTHFCLFILPPFTYLLGTLSTANMYNFLILIIVYYVCIKELLQK